MLLSSKTGQERLDRKQFIFFDKESFMNRDSLQLHLERNALLARFDFEQGQVAPELLRQLSDEDQESPLAVLYLRHRLGRGTVIKGRYGGRDHSFLMVGDLVVDITADSHGGPPIYIGELCLPWELS